MLRLSSRSLALCLVALPPLSVSPQAFATPASAPQPTASSETESAQLAPQAKFIQDLGDRAITLLADKSLSDEDKGNKFRAMLADSFDLPTIARFVIGRSWASATPEQQQEYMKLFESLVVKTYSDSFALYTGEGFKVRNAVPETEKDSVVNSDITHPDGSAATTVTWRVRTKDGKMGIIDVVVEGVSMSLTQRQEYASVIQRNGGDINALLDLMRSRVAASAPEKKPQDNNGHG